MSLIPFSSEISVELLQVTLPQIDLIELDAGFGSSNLQAFQDYLSLDGGRPGDVVTTASLDGGRA